MIFLEALLCGFLSLLTILMGVSKKIIMRIHVIKEKYANET